MRRSFWAWGWEERLPDAAARAALGQQIAAALGLAPPHPRPLPAVERAAASVPKPSVAPPRTIADLCDASPEARLRHAYGRAYRDLVRGFGCDFSAAPDFVCLPRSEEDVARALEGCAAERIAAAPYGGGTSVVGGVEAGGRGRPACSLGSEGILGAITEAWVRLYPQPRWRASASVTFPDLLAGARAARAIAQSGLYPANCRLLDPTEAMLNGVAAGEAVLMLAFESADHPLEPWMSRALAIASDEGGACPRGPSYRETGNDEARDGASARWREAFFAAPYLQSALVSLGIIADTFATACTWDRLEGPHARVSVAMSDALTRVCGAGTLTCRFTHVYPDGPAPYFTFLGPARPGSELSQWSELKSAASEAVLAAGGTITHHHAVGRTHRPWYDRERPEPFAAALRAAKRALDPAGILNPGVLID